jgi:hypothetical protein
VLAGRGRLYEARFASPLSVESVTRGVATWETAAGRFEIGPSACLIVNDGEEYAITVDALHPVETFCLYHRVP